MTRDQLVGRLAEISHETRIRQVVRDKGAKAEDLPQDVTDHDLERAQDTVRELERLGVLTGVS
jgi:hypothetical protein